MWFRADLRTADNPALHHASRDSNGRVVGVFIACPEQWRSHDWAGVRVEFLRRHLQILSDSLADLNIPLIIAQTATFDGVPRLLDRLAREHDCGAVYFNDEYEVNEQARDDAVREHMERSGRRVRSFLDQCLVQPGELRTGEGRFYTVYSPFKRALYKRLEEQGGVSVLPAPKKQDTLEIDSSDIPDRFAGFSTDIPPGLWPAGETEARSRLHRFISKRAAQYKTDRDVPALDATSVLSPYLAIGSITHRQCIAAAAEANEGRLESKNAGLTHWISEVAWREFYRHILLGFPRVCKHRAFKPATERIRWSDNDDHFHAWCEGRTGVPIVDAGMRQLATTGWMHNRVRMIAAMYLTKDLFIDWRRGEQHFMRHLIDGDLASNNGGWQWSASTGTDAAPYFRIFNPITQSRKFDPRGEYIRRFVPELEDLDGDEDGGGPIHDPSELPALLRSRLAYPMPLVDRSSVKDRVTRAFQAVG